MGNPVLSRLVDERDRIHENIDEILQSAAGEERDPSDAEKDLLARQKARLDQLEPQIVLQVEIEERRNGAVDARKVLTRRETPAPPDTDTGTDGDDSDGDDGDGYRTFAQYARDELINRFAFIGAQVDTLVRRKAQQRLDRAVEQVLVANVGPLVRPQYINEIMQLIDPARPLVAASRSIALTSGKLQYPRITNRPDVAEQVTEKTEVGDGSMTVTMVEAVAKTYLTAANFSWQTIQWSNPDALQLWFDLAAESYARQTDAAVGALLAGADAAPTAVSANTLEAWMAAVTAAAGEVYANTGRYADTIAADPATGFELLGLVSVANPVFLATGQGSLATGGFPAIGGLRFVISRGLPADTVIVGDFDALLTAETAGSPVELRAVEPSIGGLEVGIIGAFAADIVDPGAFAEVTPPVVTP